MSKSAPDQGFAARLLSRAEGRVCALRPKLNNTFGAETAHAGPLLELSEEVAAAPSTSAPEAPSALHRSVMDPASESATPLHLMPGERPEVRALQGASEPQLLSPDTVVAAPPPSVDRTATAASQSPAEMPPSRVDRSLRFEERRSDTLLAAVTQLLGPQSAADAAAPSAEPRGWPDRFAADNPAAAFDRDWGSGAPISTSEQPPLQIHIGELVIAPEPRAPQHEAAAPAAWAPPLSLADYRASRTRAQP